MKFKNKFDKEHPDDFKGRLKNIGNSRIENCPPAEQLCCFFKEELSGRQKKNIEDHLDFCPLCGAALESLKTAKTSDTEQNYSPENWAKEEKKLDETFYSSFESISIKEKETTKVANLKKYCKILSDKWFSFIDTFLAPKIIVYAGSLTILLVISIYSVAYLGRSDFYSLAYCIKVFQ